MPDFIYPLPIKNLHTRYDPVFSALKRGQSVTLIGLPQSARSGYLKFILEYDPKFLHEFIDPDSRHFLVIDQAQLSGDELIHFIAGKFAGLNFLSSKYVQLLESRLKIHDPHLTLSTLQHILTSLYPAHKFTLVLYEAEKLLHENSRAVDFISSLWNTNRNQPNSQVTLLFIGSPILLDQFNHPSWSSLRPALVETQINYQLFSDSEMDYLKKRIEHLSQVTIPPAVHQLARFLSGGHTVLYRLLCRLTFTELKQLSVTRSHPDVNPLLAEIWAGIPSIHRQNWSASYPFFLPLLPPASQVAESVTKTISLPLLTSQQKIIFDYLADHLGQIIPRDNIAQVIWGKLWQDKYSDWAIDQAISKLKRKLKSSPYVLSTIRNRGYQLTLDH